MFNAVTTVRCEFRSFPRVLFGKPGGWETVRAEQGSSCPMGVACIQVLRAHDPLRPGSLAASARTGIRESTTPYELPAVGEILRRPAPAKVIVAAQPRSGRGAGPSQCAGRRPAAAGNRTPRTSDCRQSKGGLVGGLDRPDRRRYRLRRCGVFLDAPRLLITIYLQCCCSDYNDVVSPHFPCPPLR